MWHEPVWHGSLTQYPDSLKERTLWHPLRCAPSRSATVPARVPWNSRHSDGRRRRRRLRSSYAFRPGALTPAEPHRRRFPGTTDGAIPGRHSKSPTCATQPAGRHRRPQGPGGARSAARRTRPNGACAHRGNRTATSGAPAGRSHHDDRSRAAIGAESAWQPVSTCPERRTSRSSPAKRSPRRPAAAIC